MSDMNDPFALNGKKFLVTGASSGIGYETCKAIDRRGGSFIATARREEYLARLISECKSNGNRFVAADLAKEGDIHSLVKSVNKIDGVVHSAGVVSLAPAKFYSSGMMESMRVINYDSILRIMTLILKEKKINRGGSIVLISSISAMFGMNGNGIYAGTKGALIAVAKVWANELSSLKIRVNCVLPGMVRTEITQRSVEDLSRETIQEDEKKYPLGYGDPEQVANPIVFLLSEASSWITGQNLIIDGGRTACI